MKTLAEILEIVGSLSEEMFDKMCDALDRYYERGGALRLHRMGIQIGLTIDEMWAWENI